MKLIKLKEKILKSFKNPKLITGVISGLIVNIFIFSSVSADFLGIGSFTQKAVYTLFNWIASAIAWLGSQIIILEAKLLSWVLDASVFTKMPVVQAGWRICRDLANMFFVFILVYIAFCYILRIQSQSTKKLIVKVIIIAVLINFSLMIGGVIIDFSNVFFRFFVFGGLKPQDGEKVTTSLANALKLQTLVESNILETPTASSTPEDWQAWIQNQMAQQNEKTILIGFGKLMFTIIFTFLMIIVFGALIVILFVRLFQLWILLIFAPLAWTASLIKIKGTPSDLADNWWKNFLKWSFVAPILGMFIYLALETSKHLNNLNVASNLNTSASNMMYSIQNILQMVLVAGFLIAGFIAGQKMGEGIAGSALNLAKSTGGKVGGAIKDRSTLLAARAGGAIGGAINKGAAENEGLRAIVGLTGIGAASRYAVGKAEEMEKKQWSERTKKYENVSVDQLNKMKDSALMPKERAAMYSVLAKKDKLEEKDIDKAIPLLSKYDKETYKTTIEKHPDWHPDIRTAAKSGDVQNVVQVLRVKNIDSSKLNLEKIADPIVLEAAIKFKIQTDPEEAAKSLRNINLSTLNKYTAQIKEEFDKLDDLSQKEFLKRLRSGFSGRTWAVNNLKPKVTLFDSKDNPIK